MAMFPPSIPRYFIEKCTRPGDMVLDPFCGRGTTPLEACLSGRIGVGNDLNPVAYYLTRAKIRVPAYDRVLSRLQQLEEGYEPLSEAKYLLDSYRELSKDAAEIQQSKPSGNPGLDRAAWEHLMVLIRELRELYVRCDPNMPYFTSQDYDFREKSAKDIGYEESFHHKIWLFYHPETLRQLVYLKRSLGSQPEDEFIKALVLGIMHGRGKHYLSLPMPNTFSMTPRYVLAYSYKNMLILPEKNVFDCLRRKMALIDPLPAGYVQGAAFSCDIRDLPGVLEPFLDSAGQKPKLLVSSPPYLGVVKYGQYNWIRLWFLEEQESVPGQDGHREKSLEKIVDAVLDDGHHDLESYLKFMRESLEAVLQVMAPKSISAWVIGDVGEINLAAAVWEQSARPLGGYRKLGIIADNIDEGKKVTKIWGAERGRATKIDRILILERT
ncbi:MAG TPA: site-specific DNA-methyltransferase [Firmicutes bacterium]|nr:site-specific DNA-methyltransferase [Candidatus Fermentithermobacillaceae bacterium]